MASMRVVMVSKALVVGAFQRKGEELARLGVDLTVLVPPVWRDSRGVQRAVPVFTQGYTYRTIPCALAGNFHLHFYPTLARELAALRPHVLHMDEEPYNLATWQALRAAGRQHIPALFFTWQNLKRRYPPPFSNWEQANYRRAAIAIAGSSAAAEVLRRKGYAGELAVIPQFGVDPIFFSPAPERRLASAPLQIGYAGGLIPEKGVDLLLQACAGLAVDWRLTVAGEGGERPVLERVTADLGIADRVVWAGPVSSTDMPAFYRQLDVLALPSRTRANWKEQFGRVLVEAMACEVAVVGSTSGEIPQVIGDAGRIFPEGDALALRAVLHELADHPESRLHLGTAGRRRVLERFTMAQIARQTLAVYCEIAPQPQREPLRAGSS
jgi:glycosyltransferase involved in cell wall biosynthesis